MLGSAARDAWLGPAGAAGTQKVWPEDHEKSTKNRNCRPGNPSRLRNLSRGTNTQSIRPSARCDTKQTAAISGTDARRPAAKGCASENQRELQLGNFTGHRQGPLWQYGSGPAPPRMSGAWGECRPENRGLHREGVSLAD